MLTKIFTDKTLHRLQVTMLRSALVAVLLGTAHAFAPLTSNRALIRGVPAYAEADLVTVNDDNVKASVAITGFAAGFVLGGPVTGAIGSALANYIANKVNSKLSMAAGLKIAFCVFWKK